MRLPDVPKSLTARRYLSDGELVPDVRDPLLGGTAPSTLIRAGHVRAHHAQAAATADLLFRAAPPQHCLHRS